MSQEVVQEVLKKLGSEPKFRKRIRRDSAATLEKDYANQLTEAEKHALEDMIGGFASDLKQAEQPWWQPSSFKELGGGCLSVVLVVLFSWVLSQTLGLLASAPQLVQIGDTTQMVNAFDRAKDLLEKLFPWVTAVVTFWLGVAVEGKRADENKETADNSEAREQMTRANAAATIGTAKGQVMALRDATRSLVSAIDATMIDSLIKTLEEGERSVRH
jgi:hypothetical protein